MTPPGAPQRPPSDRPAPAAARGPAPPAERLLLRLGTTPGQLLWAALATVVASGVLLGVLYDPGAPLASVEAIQEAVPLGWLVRAVHRVSAHALLALLLIHVADHVLARTYRTLAPAAWWQLVAVTAMTLAAMLGGFVLRGDAEAQAAHAVAVNTTRAIPGLGPSLSAFLWGNPDAPGGPVYLHHLVTFTLLPWLLSLSHARRAWAGWLVSAAWLAGAIALALVFHPGPGASPSTARAALSSPWYLAGLQTGLRFASPLLAGVLWPAALLLGLGALGHVSAAATAPDHKASRPETLLRWALGVGLALYGAASVAHWVGA